jgi:hypothetical protein
VSKPPRRTAFWLPGCALKLTPPKLLPSVKNVPGCVSKRDEISALRFGSRAMVSDVPPVPSRSAAVLSVSQPSSGAGPPFSLGGPASWALAGSPGTSRFLVGKLTVRVELRPK